jgi:hypothetical protein
MRVLACVTRVPDVCQLRVLRVLPGRLAADRPIRLAFAGGYGSNAENPGDIGRPFWDRAVGI